VFIFLCFLEYIFCWLLVVWLWVLLQTVAWNDSFTQGSHASWKVPVFLSKMSRTWRLGENEFGPGKPWKLKFKVLESPGIYLCFKLTNMTFMYRTPCVNKYTKYLSKLLNKEFLHNLRWTFRDRLCSVTPYVSNFVCTPWTIKNVALYFWL